MTEIARQNPGDLWSLWGEAISMATLHSCRTHEEVADRMADELERLLPGASVALCLGVGDEGRCRVDIAFGDQCPWSRWSEIDPKSWDLPESQRLPVTYREHRLGTLFVGREIADEERALLSAMVAHYGVALGNLTLNKESREATEHYCASLQALEEGIVLFQEEEPEAVQARLLALAASMVQATAGALYVLRDIGNLESGVELQETLGIPDTLLEGFRGEGGVAWPDCLLGSPAGVYVRERGDSFASLDLDSLPPILHNVIVLPMHYHGVHAGLCVLFNASIEGLGESELVARMQSLGQLGAALLHRIQLESVAAQSRAIERELEIAEVIQKQFIPTEAPPTDDYEFAWLSLAAQHIGGDYLDVVTSDLGDICAVIADVSGHGINSALLMGSFRSTYRADASWKEPEELAASLNEEVVHEVGATGMFITAVMLRLEKRTKAMTITSAGHNTVFLWRQRTGSIEAIDSHGPPLGFLGGMEYDRQTIDLESGDIVLLYTDGVTEAFDAEMEMFGEERLAEVLLHSTSESAEEIVEAVRRALNRFSGTEQRDDDVSLLVIKVC